MRVCVVVDLQSAIVPLAPSLRFLHLLVVRSVVLVWLRPRWATMCCTQ